MSTLMVRKVTQGRSPRSVFEMDGVPQVHATAIPRRRGVLSDQARDALDAIAQAMAAEEASGAVVHQVVFLANSALITPCRQILRAYYGASMPATSYLPQPPCAGTQIAIEALGLGQARQKVEIERISEQLVVSRSNDVAWIHADHAVPRTSALGVYEKTICGYQHLCRLLPEAGAGLEQVLRTWLYLGGIVDDEGPTQRYKELNRARADVYQDVSFLADRLPEGHASLAFPASTGIGTSDPSLSLSALALVSDREDVVAVPLENPRQTAAYRYSAFYSPSSPRFSRGMALCCGADTTLFISGTASITHAETRHVGNVVAQTHELLENISALIGEENLRLHGLPGRGTTLEGMGVARVYIKHAEDYLRVREVVEQRLGKVPASYVVADVCRPDLLVEIEGIAYSCSPATALPVRRCHGRGDFCPPQNSGQHPLPLCPEACPERLLCPYAVRK